MILAAVCVLFLSGAGASPIVAKDIQTFWLNNFTLLYIQINMFLCIYKGFITILLGDGGKYFDNCYSNFVGSALFY
jgi:hypothetical protein